MVMRPHDKAMIITNKVIYTRNVNVTNNERNVNVSSLSRTPNVLIIAEKTRLFVAITPTSIDSVHPFVILALFTYTR